MKRILVMLVFLTLSAATGLNAGVKDKLLLYLPNRIIDMTDIFSLSLGFGPTVSAEMRATRAFSFGGAIGASGNLIKDYNRQYGYALDNGWSWSFTCIGAESMERSHTNRWVQEYWNEYTGYTDPSNNIYDFSEGARDYWELGVSAGLLVTVHAALHPVEIADFITGWFFIDLKGDDITSEDFEE
jgi:hypothetical protein